MSQGALPKVCKYLTKQLVQELMHPSLAVLQYSRRKTLTADMVIHVAGNTGYKLYGTGDEAATKKASKAKTVAATQS